MKKINNTNGGSFMNKLFKVGALLSLALISAIFVSCSGSDGKDGPGGQGGAKGLDCTIESVSGVPHIVCGERSWSLAAHQGVQGGQGDQGHGCDMQVSLDKEGYWDVICEGEFIGWVRQGELTDCTLHETPEALVVTCGDDTFSMSLCPANGDKQFDGKIPTTYDAKKFFCGTNGTNYGLLPLCHGDVYDYTTKYCARNLVVEVERTLEDGVLKSTEYFDLDTNDMSSDNWMVLLKTEVFARVGSGDPIIGEKSEVGKLPPLVTTSALAGLNGADWGNLTDAKGVDGLGIGMPSCGKNAFFNPTDSSCTKLGRGTTEPMTGCTTVMANSNVCYSGEAPADGEVFAKSCLLGTDNPGVTDKVFYNPTYVKGCNADRRTAELAIECAADRYWSELRYRSSSSAGVTPVVVGKGFNGTDLTKLISCVKNEIPTFCPVGSSRDNRTCVITAAGKKPECPDGYDRGTTALVTLDEDSEVEVLDYCVANVSTAECPVGTAPGTGAEFGSCIATAASQAIPVPTGYAPGTEQFTLTLTAATAGVCPNGYAYDPAADDAAKCKLTSVEPTCYFGYNKAERTIGDDDEASWYCIYVPTIKDCPPKSTFDSVKKMCKADPDEPDALSEPNCPYIGAEAFSEADGVCYEEITSLNCVVGATWDDEESKCVADNKETTCPASSLPGTVAATEDGVLCTVSYESACKSRIGDFEYDQETNKCFYSGSETPACKQDGKMDVFVNTCSIEITSEMCLLNYGNQIWNGISLFDDSTTPIDWNETAFFAEYVKSEEKEINDESVTVLVQECRFVETADLAPKCDEVGLEVNSRTGRCEDLELKGSN